MAASSNFQCCLSRKLPASVPSRPHSFLAGLRRRFLRAVAKFALLEPGDRVLVAFSGGKDSFCLLELLEWWRGRHGNSIEVVPVHVDHGFSAGPASRVARWLRARGGEFVVERPPIARLVSQKLAPGARTCSLCSRLRRGTLYGLASRRGFNKIALGHHADDLVETMLLNLMFTGQLKSMPPLLRSEDGRNTVIRPLALIWERETRAYAAMRKYRPVCCGCPACGERDNPKRRVVKGLVERLEAIKPGSARAMLRALGRLDPKLGRWKEAESTS